MIYFDNSDLTVSEVHAKLNEHISLKTLIDLISNFPHRSVEFNFEFISIVPSEYCYNQYVVNTGTNYCDIDKLRDQLDTLSRGLNEDLLVTLNGFSALTRLTLAKFLEAEAAMY